MTKKDYELIAKALWAAKPLDSGPDEIEVWVSVVNQIGQALKTDNDAFQFHKFYRACGYPEI